MGMHTYGHAHHLRVMHEEVADDHANERKGRAEAKREAPHDLPAELKGSALDGELVSE